MVNEIVVLVECALAYQKHLNVNLNVCWLTFSTALEALCATSRSSTSWRRPSPSSHSPSRPQPSPIPWVRASTSRGGSSSRDLSLPLDHSRLQVRPSQKLQFTFLIRISFPSNLLADENMFFEGPVDHCDAKGCSHKCSYNYDFEDYVCTCPRHLVLGEDGHTCEQRQDGEQPPSDNASGQCSFHPVWWV